MSAGNRSVEVCLLCLSVLLGYKLLCLLLSRAIAQNGEKIGSAKCVRAFVFVCLVVWVRLWMWIAVTEYVWVCNILSLEDLKLFSLRVLYVRMALWALLLHVVLCWWWLACCLLNDFFSSFNSRLRCAFEWEIKSNYERTMKNVMKLKIVFW